MDRLAEGLSDRAPETGGIPVTGSDPVRDPKTVKFFLAALQWDYGKPERGYSNEYYNIYLTLQHLFHLDYFPFDIVLRERGREGMNRDLLERIRTSRPDIACFVLFGDEFIPEVIEEARRYTTTVGYFFDDMWRTEYARVWVPRFEFVATSSSTCLRRYRDMGYSHAIYSPFGYNHFLYSKRDLPKAYDVSFVGGSHEWREWMIGQLRKAGIRIAVWGGGKWGTGKLPQEEMIEVFNQTRINLNISNCANWDARYLFASWRNLRNTLQSPKTRDQLKARLFEVTGCGGFLLTYYVEDLERCFEIGREVEVYMDIDHLIEKIRYYLRHEDEREAIALAGYRRTVAEHTFAARFESMVAEIVRRKGLSYRS